MKPEPADRHDPGGSGSPYPIELLLMSAPVLDADRLGEALSARLGPVKRSDEAPARELHFLPDKSRFAGTGGAVATRLVFREGEPADHARLRSTLAQSFDLENGETRLENCRASVSMAAIAGPALAGREFRKLISAGLLALLECVEAELIFWPPSGQLLDPAKARSKLSEPAQRTNPTYGFVNVRLFNVEENGTRIMDTLGLGALGLTDLQIHFKDLDKAAVADLLYSIAAYLMEKGNVIENGHTVPGLLAGESWTCLHAMALVEPDRLVLDIDPGLAFSAGGAD